MYQTEPPYLVYSTFTPGMFFFCVCVCLHLFAMKQGVMNYYYYLVPIFIFAYLACILLAYWLCISTYNAHSASPYSTSLILPNT